jgi:RNA-directed DNA polymerase
LGFGFYFAAGGAVGVRVHAKAWKRLKARFRQLTRRNAGGSIEHVLARLNRFIAGWCAYFGVAAGRKRFEALDKWVRHRLRAIQWKQWKRYRTKRRNLVALGVPDDQAARWAATSKGAWRIAGSVVLQVALPTAHWDDLGYRGFSRHWHRRRAA